MASMRSVDERLAVTPPQPLPIPPLAQFIKNLVVRPIRFGFVAHLKSSLEFLPRGNQIAGLLVRRHAKAATRFLGGMGLQAFRFGKSQVATGPTIMRPTT